MATFIASMGRPFASLHNFYTINALATFLLLVGGLVCEDSIRGLWPKVEPLTIAND